MHHGGNSIAYFKGRWFMSSDSSYKGPFEFDDVVDKLDVEEDDASSANNSDEEDEHTEPIEESSEIDPMDIESPASSLMFPSPILPSMIPFTFIISRKI